LNAPAGDHRRQVPAPSSLAAPNAATLVTVLLGVLCLYGALLVVTFLTAQLLLEGGVLQDTLRHPVDAGDYLNLAWLTTSAAVVGGALGSGLESDEAVRRAAYSNREAERRTEQGDDAGTP
jgi:hypothetical protein